MIARFWWGEGEKDKIHWINWKEMCHSKSEGGLGFRDLRAFNQAMLGKQVWRILNNPNSLLSKIFKAKYFADGDILNSKLKSNASFTWKSIHGAIELVKTGVKWRIGNGKNVDIWRDNWIPRYLAMKPRTPDIRSVGPTPVSMLLDPFDEGWDMIVLNYLFWKEDIEEICKIPLGSRDIEDSLAWGYTKNGIYSVRSAYHLAMNIQKKHDSERNASSSNQQILDWNFVWKTKIPNKIKIFFWRLLKKALPTRANLRRRKVIEDDQCPVCDGGREDEIHLFRDCDFARCFWAVSPFRRLTICTDTGNIWDWVMSVKTNVDWNQFNLFCICCWSIWNNRNKIIHDNIRFDPQESVIFSRNFLNSYEDARFDYKPPTNITPQTRQEAWSPPDVGVIKINFDAAVFTQRGEMGLGVVARDSNGVVIAWKRKNIKAVWDPIVAELAAAREAINLGIKFNWQNIILEGDCIQVINKLKERDKDYSDCGVFLDDIRPKIAKFRSATLLFVHRECNMEAHRIAHDGKGAMCLSALGFCINGRSPSVFSRYSNDEITKVAHILMRLIIEGFGEGDDDANDGVVDEVGCAAENMFVDLH